MATPNDIVSGLPSSWSDWIAFIGGILGALAFFLQAWVLFVDRASVEIDVKLVNVFGPLQSLEPSLRPEDSGPMDRPRYAAIVRVTNSGRRAVHLESLLIQYEHMQGSVPFVRVLDEANPKAAYVIDLGEADVPVPRERVHAVTVVTGTGERYTATTEKQERIMNVWEYILQR